MLSLKNLMKVIGVKHEVDRQYKEESSTDLAISEVVDGKSVQIYSNKKTQRRGRIKKGV